MRSVGTVQRILFAAALVAAVGGVLIPFARNRGEIDRLGPPAIEPGVVRDTALLLGEHYPLGDSLGSDGYSFRVSEAPMFGSTVVTSASGEARSLGKLVVRVSDEVTGIPLSGTTVSVQTPGASSGNPWTHASSLTLADGKVTFEVPAGVRLETVARATSENDSYVEQVDALSSGEQREIQVELPAKRSKFHLRTLSRVDRRPVAGAVAELVVDGLPRGEKLKAIRGSSPTDDRGLAELIVPEVDMVTLRVTAPGYAEKYVQVSADRVTPDEAKVVLLSPASSLRVTVRGSRGHPLYPGVVRLWTDSRLLASSDDGRRHLSVPVASEWSRELDSAGACVFEGLPPDVPLEVEILQKETLTTRALPPVVLLPGEAREVEWSTSSECTIEGLMVDSTGLALPGVKVRLQRATSTGTHTFRRGEGKVFRETQTDLDGRFVFTDLSPGTWWVGPSPRACVESAFDSIVRPMAPLATPVEFVGGCTVKEVVVQAYQDLFIDGRVVDARGRPVERAVVTGYHADEAMFWTRADEDGVFSLGPLPPGQFRVWAGGGTAGSRMVDAKAGDIGLRLSLDEGGILSGIVRDAETSEPCVGGVTVVSADPRQNRSWKEQAEVDGRFTFEGIPPGIYCVTVEAAGGRVGISRSVEVGTGRTTSDVVVEVVPGATLRVSYQADEGYLMYRVLSDGVLFAVGGLGASREQVLSVPTGTVTLETSWYEEDSSRTSSEVRVFYMNPRGDTEAHFGAR